jgi:hypothetical protein
MFDSLFEGHCETTSDGGPEFFHSPSHDHADHRSEVFASLRIGSEDRSFTAGHEISKVAGLGTISAIPVEADDAEFVGMGAPLGGSPAVIKSQSRGDFTER